MDPIVISACIGASGAIIAALVPIIFKPELPQIFPEREVSDWKWYQDMKKAERISFLGTSHSKLATYLYQYFRHTNRRKYLHSIEIYYASNVTGEALEGRQFQPNLRQSMREIAALVCSQEWVIRFPNFHSIQFRQYNNTAAFSGTVIMYKGGKSVVYVVEHPIRNLDANESITLRYVKRLPSWIRKNRILEKYLKSYEVISSENHSQILGNFSLTLWDRSVGEWDRFSKECEAHQSSMKALIELANLHDNEKVLDLASGSGRLSEIILKENDKISLTLLDSSPIMLQSANNIIGDKARYVLCKFIDSSNVLMGSPRRYDVIFIHLSIPSLASNETELQTLAKWCHDHLTVNGRILLCAHNTALEEESDFSTNEDPLRREFRNELNAIGKPDCFRVLDKRTIRPEQINASFESENLKFVKHEVRSFTMKMRDRMTMWKAPVVLNDIIDLNQIDERQLQNIIQRVESKIKNYETPDMVVNYWVFKVVVTTAL